MTTPIADEVPEFEPDFAEEHTSFTVGDSERGGPEGVPDPDSPKGYGGADFNPSIFSQL